MNREYQQSEDDLCAVLSIPMGGSPAGVDLRAATKLLEMAEKERSLQVVYGPDWPENHEKVFMTGRSTSLFTLGVANDHDVGVELTGKKIFDFRDRQVYFHFHFP